MNDDGLHSSASVRQESRRAGEQESRNTQVGSWLERGKTVPSRGRREEGANLPFLPRPDLSYHFLAYLPNSLPRTGGTTYLTSVLVS